MNSRAVNKCFQILLIEDGFTSVLAKCLNRLLNVKAGVATLGAFSVTVKLETSRRFVCSSSCSHWLTENAELNFLF